MQRSKTCCRTRAERWCRNFIWIIGNPVKIRNSTRCCKFHFADRRSAALAVPESQVREPVASMPLNPFGGDWEGATGGTSQKTCLYAENRMDACGLRLKSNGGTSCRGVTLPIAVYSPGRRIPPPEESFGCDWRVLLFFRGSEARVIPSLPDSRFLIHPFCFGKVTSMS